jgi:transcription-repair coupling factor (superfamily II helicase)
MYHKILDDAIQDLKQNEFSDLFKDEISNAVKVLVRDCVIETDLEILIPEYFVKNITERLSLYTQIDNIKDQKELDEFIHSVEDRFGKLPEEVINLFKTVRLRWLAIGLGFEKLTLKNGKMKCNFLPSDNEAYFNSDDFGKILQYVQQNGKFCSLKEIKDKLLLIISGVDSIDKGVEVLGEIK